MNELAGYAELAKMSEASYVRMDLLDYRDEDQLKRMLTEEDFEGEFSQAQADAFIQHWGVVHHLPNSESGSGFSATLFRRKAATPGDITRGCQAVKEHAAAECRTTCRITLSVRGAYFILTSSTLRFLARPSSSSLDATGWVSP